MSESELKEYYFEGLDHRFVNAKSFDYSPKNDITVYELALIVPVFTLNVFSQSSYVNNLPDCAKRHFVEVE